METPPVGEERPALVARGQPRVTPGHLRSARDAPGFPHGGGVFAFGQLGGDASVSG